MEANRRFATAGMLCAIFLKKVVINLSKEAVKNQRNCALLRSVEMSHLTQNPVEMSPRI
jgi:branched-subunit amino acid transport protein